MIRRAARKQKKQERIVIANWKMNPPDVATARALFRGVKKVAALLPHVSTVICPPFPLLSAFAPLIARQRKVSLGVQSVFYENSGAYTGEVAAPLVRDIGASYAIIGHSERRAQGESDEVVAKKVRAALHAGLIVILCIGETARDPDGDYLGHIKKQLRNSLTMTEKIELRNVLIAYEPVWAIGGTKAVSGHDIHQSVIFIKKALGEIYSTDIGRAAKVLYGGSTTPENVVDILTYGEVSGLLVGGSSLDVKKFGAILKAAENVQ